MKIVIFGLTADEVTAKRKGGYEPRKLIEASPEGYKPKKKVKK